MGRHGLRAGSRGPFGPSRRGWRCWRWLPAGLIGLSAPAAFAQALQTLSPDAAGVNDASCRTMAPPLVYGFTLLAAFGTLAGLHLVKRRLQREGWSLANALSEPTRLTIPLDWRWTESAGDQEAMAPSSASARVLRGSDGAPVAVTLLEASSSRMIASLGAISILMLFLGFGTFALFSFGLTCQLPASMSAVSSFLLSGLSLFAPYVANKVSAALQPGSCSADQGASAPAAGSASAQRLAAVAPALQADPQGVIHEAAAPERSRPSAAPRAVAPEQRSSPIAPAAAPAAVPGPSVPEPLRPRPAPAATAPGAGSAQAAAGYGPALDLIREFEGFVDHAYPDPATGAEPWTIGYGFTTLAGQPVQAGQTISLPAADAELQRQVQACAAQLAATIPDWRLMNQNQQCALLDFAWNLGAGFYGDSSDFASISADLRTRNWAQVPQTLLLYCDPGSDVEAGLLRRREAEAALWQRPEPSGASGSTAPAPSATRLQVPYCDQLLMADGQGWRECFSASSAMLAMYWGKEPSENVYDSVRARYGDSTSSEAQLEALRSLGLQADFRTDGSAALLRQEIDAGRPVAVGWLCDGPVSSPSGGGHWSVIIGYDAEGFFINDPYGNCDLVNGGYLSHHDGAGLHYSSRNWLPRWQVGGSGGWLLTCRRPA